MSERLRKNQLMFDAHIKSMEDALKAGRKELGDVTVYLRQVCAGFHVHVSVLAALAATQWAASADSVCARRS